MWLNDEYTPPSLCSLFAAVIPAIASVAGSMIAASGQRSTNAQNAIQAQDNIDAQRQAQSDQMNFDATEAQLGRNYDMNMAQVGEQWTLNNMAEAERYDTQMSNTAYQRSVADMKAAGLNPILGVASGGASTPNVGNPAGSPGAASPAPTAGTISGAQATMQNPGAYIAAGLNAAVNSAMSAVKMGQDIQQTQANIAQTQAQTANTVAQNPGVKAQSDAQVQFAVQKAGVDLQNTQEAVKVLQSQYGLNSANSAAAVASAQASSAAAGMYGAQGGLAAAQAQKYLQSPPGVMPGTSSVGSTIDYFGGRTSGVTGDTNPASIGNQAGLSTRAAIDDIARKSIDMGGQVITSAKNGLQWLMNNAVHPMTTRPGSAPAFQGF